MSKRAAAALPEYPEHQKLLAAKPRSEVIGAFIEWLPTQNLWFCKVHVHDEDCTKFCEARHDYYGVTVEALLARYFEIDLNVIETEKRAMLDEIRNVGRRGGLDVTDVT